MFKRARAAVVVLCAAALLAPSLVSGAPPDQANGRGDIDLVGYVRTLHENGYVGTLDLEIIGTKRLGYTLE